MLENFGCFWTYFNVMNDYGFSPAVLFGLNIEPGIMPNPTDVYNPNDKVFKGNTRAA